MGRCHMSPEGVTGITKAAQNRASAVVGLTEHRPLILDNPKLLLRYVRRSQLHLHRNR